MSRIVFLDGPAQHQEMAWPNDQPPLILRVPVKNSVINLAEAHVDLRFTLPDDTVIYYVDEVDADCDVFFYRYNRRAKAKDAAKAG